MCRCLCSRRITNFIFGRENHPRKRVQRMVWIGKISSTSYERSWITSRRSRRENWKKSWANRFHRNRRSSPRQSIRHYSIHEISRNKSLGINRRQSRNSNQHRSISRSSRQQDGLNVNRINRLHRVKALTRRMCLHNQSTHRQPNQESNHHRRGIPKHNRCQR